MASVVPLDQAIDALAALERAPANGKTVVNVADTAGADIG